MAKSARPGEMRTRIRVMDYPRGDDGQPALDADGYPIRDRVNVFGDGAVYHCKWVNAHGSEVYTAQQAGVTEPATLTMRYTAKITTTAEIYRESDPAPYEVISLNDVEDRHTWLEVKVKRKGASV